MSPHKRSQSVSKAPVEEASASGSFQEEEVDTQDPYMMTLKGSSIKKLQSNGVRFTRCSTIKPSPKGKDGFDLKIFKNIRKSKLYKVATHNSISLCRGHFMDSEACGLGDQVHSQC
jgi:hypothetical protein